MNKLIFLCITLPSFLVATFIFHNAAAQTCTGNLLTNPGFESGLNDWSTTGDVTMSTNAYSGTKAAKVGGSGYASVGQLKPTTSGTSYTAKVWAKYSGSSFRVVELRFLNASWVTLSGAAQAEITSSVYSEYTLSGTAPAGAVYVYVIASKDGSGSIEVDDFCLTTGSGTSGLPDLVPVLQPGVTAASNNGTLTFSLAVKNQGLGSAAPDYFQSYQGYLSNDPVLSNDDLYLNNVSGYLQPQGLAPGQTSDFVNESYTIPANNSFNGIKYIIIFIDDLDGIEESDETNNQYALPVQISTTPAPNNCTSNLGAGEILCTEKSGSNLLVYLINNQVVTKYTLSGQGTVVSTQNMGTWVQDSVLVQGNQVKKKLANGTIAYTKTIPQSVLDSLPVVQAATELANGNFVLAGYRKLDNTNPISASKNNLVMVYTNANLTPIQVKSRTVSIIGNPYFTFNDQVLLLRPAPNAAFDIFYTFTTETLITYRSVYLSRYSFTSPQSFDQTPTFVANLVNLGTIAPVKLTQTPCGSYRYSGPFGSVGQKGSFFGTAVSYYDMQDLSLISSQVDGAGSADYYGSYDRWTFVSLPPDSLSGSFQYRPGFDPLPTMQFIIPNLGQPPYGVNVPYFNYDHAVVMQPNDVFLFGTNNGQVFVQVPTDCTPPVVLQPDLTGDSPTLIANPVLVPGDFIEFNFNLKNIGNYATSTATNIDIAYHLSSDAVLSANDLLVGNGSNGPLTVGAIITTFGYITLPANTPSGSYYILAKIDPNNAHLESNENNNVVASATTFTVSGGSGCSISATVTSVQCSDNGTPADPADDKYNVQIMATNQAQSSGYQVNAVELNMGINAFYGTALTIPNVPISVSTLHLILLDNLTAGCTTTLTVTAPPPCSNGGGSGQIDLSLVAQQLTANPAQWSNYSVKLTLSNSGPQAATGVKVKFAKPTGVVYVGGNEFTASQGSFNPFGDEVWMVGSIPANGSATLTVNYFLLHATAPVAYAQVSAANETDSDSQPNNGTSPTPVQDDEASTASGGGPTLQPDLTLADLQIPNASVAAGSVLNYHFDVSNIGTAAVPGNFTIKSYISTDQTLSATDVQDGTIQTGNYAAGFAAQNVPGASTIPANLAAGLYYLIVKIDADNGVAESNENNNTVVKPFTVTAAPALPELSGFLQELIPPNNNCYVNPGQGFPVFSVYITNTGTVAAGAFKVKYYFSSDNVLSANDIFWTTTNIASLNTLMTGGPAEGGPTQPVPATLPTGKYYVLVKIDADNQVSETNENNNFIGNIQLQVGSHNLKMNSISGNPASSAAGSSFTQTVQIGFTPNGFPANTLGGGQYAVIVGVYSATLPYVEVAQSNFPISDFYTINNVTKSIQVNIPASVAAGAQTIETRVQYIGCEDPTDNFLGFPITIAASSSPCAAITITPAPGKITIAGFSAPHVLIKVFRPNWTVAYECLDNCANPLVVTGLSAGPHHVQVKLINNSWGEICYLEQTVNVSNFGGGSGNALRFENSRQRLAFDNIYPNPAKYLVTLDLYSAEEQETVLDFYDGTGRPVHRMEVLLNEGKNEVQVPVFDWKSGTYNVIARGDGLPAYGRFLKVWEE